MMKRKVPEEELLKDSTTATVKNKKMKDVVVLERMREKDKIKKMKVVVVVEKEAAAGQNENKTVIKYINRPHTKMPFPQLRGWMEMAVRKGIVRGCPEFCLKKVTETDASRKQHRYQLTANDIQQANSLLVIACRAMATKNGLNVNILDKDGRHYTMLFRHIESNGYFRFMGDGWTEFLNNVQLCKGQFMTIWGLPRHKERIITNWRVPGVSRGEEVGEVKAGEYWFVFVNLEKEEAPSLEQIDDESNLLTA